MKRITIILILLVAISCKKDKCEKYNHDYIPIDLYDSIDFLNCIWSDKLKENFRKEDEKYAGIQFGRGIRNSWNLWKGKNQLCKYFFKLGIYHPDDMSSIILKSFHRKLNNKEIDLESQVNFYKEYWKEINKEQKDNKDSSFEDNTDF